MSSYVPKRTLTTIHIVEFMDFEICHSDIRLIGLNIVMNIQSSDVIFLMLFDYMNMCLNGYLSKLNCPLPYCIEERKTELNKIGNDLVGECVQCIQCNWSTLRGDL